MKKILQGMVETMNAVNPPRMTALKELHEAETEGPFSILIGTILSARTRDENTTKVMKNLLSHYKSPKALSSAKVKEVEKIIKPIGFYHVKAKRIIKVASIINSQYGGNVPDDFEKLIELPGVGRKTANCVLVYAFDKPAIPMKKIPKKYWLEINDTFVMYGQNICKPISPMCNVCKIKRKCNYYKSKKSAS